MRLFTAFTYTFLLATMLAGDPRRAWATDALGLPFSPDSHQFVQEPLVIGPGPRPNNGIDPTMFSLADAAMSTIVNGLQDAISDRLKAFRLTTIAAIRARGATNPQREQNSVYPVVRNAIRRGAIRRLVPGLWPRGRKSEREAVRRGSTLRGRDTRLRCTAYTQFDRRIFLTAVRPDP